MPPDHVIESVWITDKNVNSYLRTQNKVRWSSIFLESIHNFSASTALSYDVARLFRHVWPTLGLLITISERGLTESAYCEAIYEINRSINGILVQVNGRV